MAYLDQFNTGFAMRGNTNVPGDPYLQSGTTAAPYDQSGINPLQPKASTQGSTYLDTLGREAGRAIEGGYGQGQGFLAKMSAGYDPSIARSGRGADLYANALGVNGQPGQDAARAAFKAGPGYQFAVDQSLQGAARAASAGGMLASGNTLTALQDRASGLASQEYGGWLDRLAGYNGIEQSALGGKSNIVGQQANLAVGAGVDKAGLLSQIAAGHVAEGNRDWYGNELEKDRVARQQEADKQSRMSLIGSLLGLFGTIGGAAIGLSERAYKTDVEMIGMLKSGLPWYRFRYVPGIDDGSLHEGVMADEVQDVFPDAIVEVDGIRFVDYARVS